MDDSTPEVAPEATTPSEASETAPQEAPKTSKGSLTLYGRAIVYGPFSQPVPDKDGKLYRYRIAKGAEYVPNGPILAHNWHDKATILGNTDNKTLSLKETDLGIDVEIKLPNNHEGRKAYGLVRDEYINGMSFGMSPIESRKLGEKDGITDIEVTKYKLYEASPTARPSFPGTWLSIKPDGNPERDRIVKEAQGEIEREAMRRKAQAQLQLAQAYQHRSKR